MNRKYFVPLLVVFLFLFLSLPILPFKISLISHASGRLIQQFSASCTSACATTLGVSSPFPIQAGDILYVVAGQAQNGGTASGPVSIVDGPGNAFTAQWGPNHGSPCSGFGGGVPCYGGWDSTITHGVGGTDTVTVTFAGSNANEFLYVVEIAGVQTGSEVKSPSSSGSAQQIQGGTFFTGDSITPPANGFVVSTLYTTYNSGTCSGITITNAGFTPSNAGTQGMQPTNTIDNNGEMVTAYVANPSGLLINDPGVKMSTAASCIINYGNFAIGFQPTVQVTDTITGKILSTGGSSETATISGACSPSPATMTFSKAGTSNAITVNPSSSCLVTVAADLANSRFRGNASWTSGTSYPFTTPSSSGSMTLYNYQELQQTYQMTPHIPSTWDQAYSKTVTGTVLGVGGSAIVTITLSNGGGSGSTAGWNDNDTLETFLVSFPSTIAISPWQSITTNTFTDLTGGNTHNVNYSRFSGSNIIFVNWTGSAVNFPIVVDLVFQNSGTALSLSNPILISYIANGVSQVLSGIDGTNTFSADARSFVTVAGISVGSSNNTRWCLLNCVPQSFNVSSTTTYTANYWQQDNVSWRWIAPIICSVGCSGQQPGITKTAFSSSAPLTLPGSGGLITPTAFIPTWTDHITAWSTTNPFFYNHAYWLPSPGSGTISGPALITITYTSSNSSSTCTSQNPFIDLISGCWVGASYYSLTGAIGNFAFGLIFVGVDVALYLKTENPMVPLLIMIVQGAALGFLLPNFFLPLTAIFMSVGIAGSVYTVIRTR